MAAEQASDYGGKPGQALPWGEQVLREMVLLGPLDRDDLFLFYYAIIYITKFIILTIFTCTAQ